MSANNVTVWTGAIQALLVAALAALAYYLKFTPEEVAIWGGVVAAGIGVLTAWLNTRVVSLTELEGESGQPVTKQEIAEGETVRRAARKVSV